MLVSTIVLALVAVLPNLAVAGPLQKRFTSTVIRSGRTGTCLTLQPGVQIIDGSLLYVGDCATATKWDINPGSGSVIVSGTKFALDAGLNPHNNVPAKVWTSYPGATQQTWFLTNDNRIAITGGNQCLDEGDNGPQTYQCTTGNTNQVWYIGPATPPSTTSSSTAPSTTPVTGSQLKWKSNSNLCATVQGPTADGTPVNMVTCTTSALQRFTFVSNGLIQLANTNFCLDAGTTPSNGVQMKIWTCYPGLAQQTWIFPGRSGLVRLPDDINQCLDLDNANLSKLQTWACSTPDPQQQFVAA